MVAYTFTSLKTTVEAWAENHFSDYAEQVEDVIAKAELRLLRDLDLELFDQTDTSISTTPDEPEISLPDGALMLRSLYVNGALVLPRAESYVRYYADLVAASEPLYFCQHKEAAALLAPTPDAAYSTRMRVLIRPDGLSDDVPMTWLSTNAGDLLFAACLAETEGFHKAVDQEGIWGQKYVGLLAIAKSEIQMLARRDYR